MITIAASAEGQQEQRVKDSFFIVEPNQRQLVEVGKLLDAGTLKTFIKAVVPFAGAPAAYANEPQLQRGAGKLVVKIS